MYIVLLKHKYYLFYVLFEFTIFINNALLFGEVTYLNKSNCWITSLHFFNQILAWNECSVSSNAGKCNSIRQFPKPWGSFPEGLINLSGAAGRKVGSRRDGEAEFVSLERSCRNLGGVWRENMCYLFEKLWG